MQIDYVSTGNGDAAGVAGLCCASERTVSKPHSLIAELAVKDKNTDVGYLEIDSAKIAQTDELGYVLLEYY